MADNIRQNHARLSLLDMLLIGLFGTILVIILTAVFFRYVVNRSLFWSDEIVRYLFVWFTLIGAALVLRDRRHIRVEYFVQHMPAGPRHVVERGGLLLVLAFNVFLVVVGLWWVKETGGTYTPALRLPLNWILYAALPVSAALSSCFAARRLLAGQYAELDVGQDDASPDE
jgi:TRAP-type C4-dicarboxylate transport system permease small subunit